MVKESVGFLKRYGGIGLAIAVSIGDKFNELLKAFVDRLIFLITKNVLKEESVQKR